ncbi:MAG: ROK family transcriptional regulator [Chloroflexi bacterium]|nr:ROK family transcriptional regulator [Chloroflexota bacterium]
MDHAVTVLELLRQHERASRTELAELSGLSPATISRAVAHLRRRGLVRERVLEHVPLGRPPMVVELEASAAYLLAIDAGGSRIRASLADLEGTLVVTEHGEVRRPRDPASVIREIGRVARRAARRADGRPILAAAAGISGIVDAGRGIVLLSPDLPGLEGASAAELLGAELDMPVAIDNDDILAAVGEASVGAARGSTDVVFLSLGYGLGAGIIVGGRPLRGAASAAGAIAYFAPGRLEERASGRAIASRYAHRTHGSSDAIGAREVFHLAAAGDAVARAVVAEAVNALGELVVNVAALLDPQVIIVGGGLARNGAALVEPLADRLRSSVPFPPRLLPSLLDEAAVAQGAALLALSLSRQRMANGAGGSAVRPEPARVGMLELV